MEYDEATLKKLERDEVSGIINLLKSFSRKVASNGGQREWKMPAGRYALLTTEHRPVLGLQVEKNADGSIVNADISTGYMHTEWRFFEVSKPDKGRWTGYTFIKRLIGAPGQYRKVEVAGGPQGRNEVLAKIEADPQKAMIDYGLQSKVCGKCSSPLSDPESLARGIGPICARKLGW
jgi:hypothetical protein